MADTVRVTDHAAETTSLLDRLAVVDGKHLVDTTTEALALAQVHATLAVAQAIQELGVTLLSVAGDCDAPIVESLARIARGGA